MNPLKIILETKSVERCIILIYNLNKCDYFMSEIIIRNSSVIAI